MSLFSKAKKVAEVKGPTKEDKKVKVVVNDPQFFQKVQNLEQLQDRMKSDKAKADMISDELRDLGRDSYVNLYQQTGRNPGSITLIQENGDETASMLFVPSDKYITINKARAEELQDEYGDEIVEEKTTFSFDNAMVDRYGEILSRLIEECGEIAEEDKEKIVKAVTTYSVAKGTIDKLKDFGKVSEVCEAVKPVVSLKNVEIVRG